MSESNKTNQTVVMYASDNKNWNDSAESIAKRDTTKLAKSESSLKMDFLFFLPESFKSDTGTTSEKPKVSIKVKDKEIQKEVLYVPAKPLAGDLTVLRVTLTPPESYIQLSDAIQPDDSDPKIADAGLLQVIDGSENAPKDRVPWKYLKRSSSYNREKKRFLVTWLRTVHYQSSHILSRRGTNVTCLNCTLHVKTKIRHVNTIRTRRNACFLTTFGLCGLPYMLFLFKDVVHVCPFCKIYLGFCPAFKYPRKAEVVTDVLTPISMTNIHRFRERVASTYKDTVSKVREQGRRFSLLV